MKKLSIIILVVLLLGAGGWFVSRERSKTESQTKATQDAVANPKDTRDVKDFSNNDFSFEYPKDWVSGKGGAAAKSGDNSLKYDESACPQSELPGMRRAVTKCGFGIHCRIQESEAITLIATNASSMSTFSGYSESIIRTSRCCMRSEPR